MHARAGPYLELQGRSSQHKWGSGGCSGEMEASKWEQSNRQLKTTISPTTERSASGISARKIREAPWAARPARARGAHRPPAPRAPTTVAGVRGAGGEAARTPIPHSPHS